MTTLPPPSGDRLFRRILLGLTLGISVGLLVGERTAPLGIVADGFIKLLQINVLPYMLGSLIAGLGSLTQAESRQLARHAGRVLVPLWMTTMLLVVALSFAFPPFDGTEWFDPNPASQAATDWIALYIPANVFHALANNLIPAVVLFGILAGLALGQMPSQSRKPLVDALTAFNGAMSRISRMILATTPFGIFAIAAVTAGQLQPTDFIRLQVWIVTYAGGALLLSLWILPGLMALLTPVSRSEVLGSMRAALLTAFAAGDAFVVLPLIVETTRTLLARHGVEQDHADATVGVVVPLLFNFPHVGKVLTLAFLPFGAWFQGGSLHLTQYVELFTAGFLSLFGNLNAAIPFLLDQLQLPSDLMSIFATSSVVNSRIGALTSTMHTAAVSLLVAAGITVGLRWHTRRFATFVGGTALLVGALVIGIRVTFGAVVLDTSGPPQLAARTSGPETSLSPMPATDTDPAPGTRVDVIQQRGTLRVGIFTDAVPWVFVGDNNTVFGYDVEAAEHLAQELGVKAEFIVSTRDSAAADLTSGRIDIVMSGFVATVMRAVGMELSHPYAEEHQGYLARDHRRHLFAEDAEHDGTGLVIAIPRGAIGVADTRSRFPKATLIDFQNIAEVIDRQDVDAVLIPVDRALYWSRLHTEFAAVSRSGGVSGLVAYGMPKGELDLRNVINVWIEIREASGALDDAYTYWIRGQALQRRPPRWNVLSDVLGWDQEP
jgi:Na+/H+-dicarboxylate symporter/ABC-type amino acid transport substrate-binding protein